MERLDVATDGDLILVVSDKLEIRVHSVVMRMTSPVFRAMLGPDWAEGQIKGSAASPKQIQLPEDNAEGMRLLCLVLHQAGDKLTDNVHEKEMLDFATMANKYDCRHAVRLTSRAWFSEFLPGSGHWIKDEVLCAAYWLDEEDYFRQLSEKKILNTSFKASWEYEDYTESHQRRRMDDVTVDVKTKVENAMKAKMKAVAQDFLLKIAPCIDGTSRFMMPQWDHEENDHPCDHGDGLDEYRLPDRCNHGEDVAKAYLRSLASADIWPESQRVGKDVEEVLQAIRDFKMPDIEYNLNCRTCSNQEFPEQFATFTRDMKKAVETIPDTLWLCLSCVKEASTPKEDQKCPHWRL